MPSASRLRTGSNISNTVASFHIAVDSPPGMTRASTASRSDGRRTSTVRAPTASSAAACSRKSPWSASTPIVRVAVMRLPTAAGVALVLRQGVDVDADHRLAQAAGDLGDEVGVLECRGGRDDGLGPLGGVAGLEDAGADENALGAELHHHRGVGRGGDAA